MGLIVEQALNGIQLSAMLFLLSAGLTLVFGIMGVINLAHGSLYMIGAYAAAWTMAHTGSFLLAVRRPPCSRPPAGRHGVIELSRAAAAVRPRPRRPGAGNLRPGAVLQPGHRPAVRPPADVHVSMPDSAVRRRSWYRPACRIPPTASLIIAAVVLVAVLLYLFIGHTRAGMLVRAGATSREMVRALGVPIRGLYTLVFGLGAALAGLAGLLAAPLYTVQVGMGEQILISTFVVIVIGGVGSVRGAFAGAHCWSASSTRPAAQLGSRICCTGSCRGRTQTRSARGSPPWACTLLMAHSVAGAATWVTPRLCLRLPLLPAVSPGVRRYGQ